METTLTNQMLMCTSLCILIAALFLFVGWRRRSVRMSIGKLPPGPRGWPLVGNIFDLGTSPHSNLAALKEKYGPLIWIRLGSVNTLVVSSADAAMELFKNHDHCFCNRHMNETMRSDDRLSSTVALSQYNGYWRMMRRLYTTELIAKKRIQDTAPLRRKCVDKMISWIAEVDGTCVELTPFVLATLFNLIGNLVLSKDLMDPKSTKKSEFFVLNAELAQLIIMPNVANFIPSLSWIDPQGVKKKVQDKLNQILGFVGSFVEERRREMKLNQQLNKEKDFLDVLLEFEGNGKDEPDKISDRNLNILILELLTAGTEATVTTIEWAMTELLRNPETMKKVQTEITEVVGRARKIEETDIDNLPYLCAVAKETLRLHPGPFLVPRSVVKETKFMGYLIPKDTQVFVNAWALGRDPTAWDDPSSFKPERFLGSKVDYRGQNFEFLPFGAGRRICPGLPLAHKMLHLVLGSLLQSFEWTLDVGVTPESIDMGEKLGAVLKKTIPLRAIPRAFV